VSVKKPPLLARPFYYAARRGWIRFDPYILRTCDSQTKSEVLQRVKRWVIEYHAAPQPLEKRLRSLGYRVERAKDLVMTGILYAYRPPQ
jgi:hypothetical protein